MTVQDVTWRDVGCPACRAPAGAECAAGVGGPHVARIMLAGRTFMERNAGRINALHRPPAPAPAADLFRPPRPC